jgi:hypothetical protein
MVTSCSHLSTTIKLAIEPNKVKLPASVEDMAKVCHAFEGSGQPLREGEEKRKQVNHQTGENI